MNRPRNKAPIASSSSRARPQSSRIATTNRVTKAASTKTAAPTPTASKTAASKRAPSKPAASKAAASGPAASKAAASRPAASKAAASKTPSNAAAHKYGKRADLGTPIEGFFARQPAPLRPILQELRKLIQEVAPDAISSLKWGMPFFMIGDAMMCALGGHKSHVNLILSGPPGTYADPEGRLSGEGKTGRHLKLTRLDELPREAVRGWLRIAAELARRP